MFLEKIIDQVRGLDKTIVLPEGQDERVVKAALSITAQNIARVIVLATAEELQSSDPDNQLSQQDNIKVIDHTAADSLKEELIQGLFERRQKRGWTLEQTQKALDNRLYFGNMLVKTGHADGLVAGSIASTADMLRAAFHCIGTREGVKTASSCFFMELKEPAPNGEELLIFADCGVNPEPTPEQLADIAIASAHTHRALVGGDQKIAMLSFSTMGSADHPLVTKVQDALKIARQKIEEAGLPFMLDGEMQADAALVPAVAAKKAPQSDVAGQANILIFPDLQAANIGYKLTERLAGAKAYGPILQGLAKPVNDLSRGCSADDIVGVAAITVAQSMA